MTDFTYVADDNGSILFNGLTLTNNDVLVIDHTCTFHNDGTVSDTVDDVRVVKLDD